jgi:hypothetical protein
VRGPVASLAGAGTRFSPGIEVGKHAMVTSMPVGVLGGGSRTGVVTARMRLRGLSPLTFRQSSTLRHQSESR